MSATNILDLTEEMIGIAILFRGKQKRIFLQNNVDRSLYLHKGSKLQIKYRLLSHCVCNYFFTCVL